MKTEHYETIIDMMENFCVQYDIFIPFNLAEKRKISTKSQCNEFIADFGEYIYQVLQDEEVNAS